jgi:tRNA(Ile)-lysidine synthase
LAGMKWRAPSPANSAIKLIRPLLDVGRAQLGQYARKKKIRFREDASNASRDILRNRIRHELLPLLRRRFQPAANKTLLRLMDIAGAEAEVLSGVTQAWLQSKRPLPFASLPVAVQRRVLQVQLQQNNVRPDFEMIEFLRFNPNRPLPISPQVSVSCNPAGRLQLHAPVPSAFNPAELPVTLDKKAGECEFEGVRFRWRLEDANGAKLPIRRSGCESFDAERLGGQIVLRHWRAGDRFQPIGMSSRVKLQDWFTNRKIGPGERRQLVVATTAAGEIVWIEGERISEHCKLTPRTKRRLIWRWNRL